MITRHPMAVMVVILLLLMVVSMGSLLLFGFSFENIEWEHLFHAH